MPEERIFIKNMVCPRCIRVVKEELENVGIDVLNISLGEALIKYKNDSEVDKSLIKSTLQQAGFDLLDDRKLKTIEKVKGVIIDLIHRSEISPHQNFSEIIAKEIGKDYHSISTLFSSLENITIEKYIIHQKIERVKELLFYNELSLSEIAFKLSYSSVAHLSTQFKQTTGMTPSQFKKAKGRHNSIDKL